MQSTRLAEQYKAVTIESRVRGYAARKQSSEPYSRLTPRQIEILMGIMEGLSDIEICEDIGISLGTLRVHRAAMLRRIGARNRTQAAAIGAAALTRNDERD